MARLVHITKAENKSSIIRSGIKLGKYNKIVFFMPVIENYLVSHQWARELKGSGVKNFIAVDFKISPEELIWYEKYSEGHELLPLGKAIENFSGVHDGFGYEFFIERKIQPKEILKIRTISKPIGWRYEPSAHGKKPCPCPMCVQPGGYKTNKIKEKHSEVISRATAREILVSSNDEDELLDALERMKGKWRKESPEYLERLLNFEDEYVKYALVELLAEHRHPLSEKYLRIISISDDEDASELAIECLQRI